MRGQTPGLVLWPPLFYSAINTHMSFEGMLVTEIFHSIQGETSLSGVPFVFIRLTGCNLRCTYCDSAYAFKNGTKMSLDDVIENVKKYEVKHVLLTGGEPLLQRNTGILLDRLISENYKVSIETHGEISIENFYNRARIIMDIKTPSSKMNREGYKNNLKFLKKTDEIKFVIASKSDYEWAKNIVKNTPLPTDEILFSPALNAYGMPGTFEGVNARWLAEKILEDRLPVRFQIQLHKYIWGQDTRGV